MESDAPLRFSIRVNNDVGIRHFVELAKTAEASGFDQLWVSHDLMLRSAPVLVTAALEATTSLVVGIGILNPYSQTPAEIAMTAATLSELSGGRFALGIAAGAGDFLRWIGLEQRRPLSRCRETILGVRALLEGKRPLAGEHFSFPEECYLRFEHGSGRVPIYLGANGPRMLRLAGEVADGVLPLLFPPEHYFQVNPLIQEGVALRFAELPTLDLAACLWVSIDENEEQAERCLRAKIAYYGHALSDLILGRLGVARADLEPMRRAMSVDRDLDRAIELMDPKLLALGVTGTPDTVARATYPLLDAGVRHLSFGPPLGPDPMIAVELLGRVASRLRERSRPDVSSLPEPGNP